MKNESPIDEDKLKYQEQKDLIEFLRNKGYDQIFRLGRAFVALEHTKCRVHRDDEPALKVIVLQDPSMAESPPENIWEDRDEVYVTGYRFGLFYIVTVRHDGIEKTKVRRVLEGKSREDWRAEVERWPKSGNFAEDSIGGLDPKSEERQHWRQRFDELGEKLYQFLEEYDSTVIECRRAVEEKEGNGAYQIYKQREEIDFLDRDISIKQLKDVGLLQKLRDTIVEKKQQMGEEYVVGEWYCHKGLGIAVDGHGWYTKSAAQKVRQEYGDFGREPFFRFCTALDLEKKIARLAQEKEIRVDQLL